MSNRGRRAVAAVVASVMVTGAVAGEHFAANATVPPENCGIVKGKRKGKTFRYRVKADQVSCRTAKSAVKTYFSKRKKPRGYTCQTKFAKNSKYRLYCYRGARSIFAFKP